VLRRLALLLSRWCYRSARPLTDGKLCGFTAAEKASQHAAPVELRLSQRNCHRMAALIEMLHGDKSLA
jgi:hypothetical protein